MANRRTLKLTFEGGLLESQEDAVRPAGYADELTNWLPEAFGGVRAKVGWVKPAQAGVPQDVRARGIGSFSRQTDPVLVQWVSSTVESAYEVSATWLSPTQQGSLLIAAFLDNVGGAGMTPPAGWTQVHSQSGCTYLNLRVYIKENAASETDPVLFQCSSPVMMCLTILEYSGIALSAPFNTYATAATNLSPGGSVTTPALAQASELTVAFIGGRRLNASPGVPTLTTGQRAIDTANISSGSVNLGWGVFDKSVRSTAGVTATSTWATSVENLISILAFKGWNTNPAPSSLVQELVVANSEPVAGEHVMYRAPLGALTPWTEADAVTTPSHDNLVAFAAGLQRLWFTSPSWTSGRSWDGIAADATTDVPPGRTIAFHKERLWVGGVDYNPSALFFCEVGDPTIWAGANVIYVGRDDGEPILDLCSFQDGLLIAKQNSVWFLTGSSASTFSLVKIETGGGAPGRCICSTPYGAIIAADGRVYQWTGTGLELISRPIERTYTLDGGPVYTLFHDNMLYIVPQDATYTFGFNFETGVWHREHMPTNARLGPLLNYGTRMFSAPPSATSTLITYRDIPNVARAKDYDTLSEWFLAETSEVWPVGPDRRITPLHLHVRVRQRGGNPTHTGITITPYYDGKTEDHWAQYLEPHELAGTFRHRFDVGFAEGINSVKFRFEQFLPSAEAAVFDIDEVRLEVNVEERA